MFSLQRAIRGLFTLLVLLAGAAVQAQSSLDTGSLRGKVLDSKGKTLPGAIVRAKGPQGTKASETDSQGNYNLPFLTPGVYDLTVTMDGYSTQVQSGVVVVAQQITGQSFKLSEGTDTVIVKAGAGVDVSSTTATTKVNLSEAVQAFAQDRSFTAAFDFAPGAIANSGVGGGNYSIAGASGLENQYFVGGVNITNSGYGAIGAYDVVRGATGTGITTEFLDNLDIREGGFEAEYGGALGGVISATIKSGSNDFHGEVLAYYSPRSLQGTHHAFAYQTGGYTLTNAGGTTNLEAGVALGGPIIKDRLFFYVAYNPVWDESWNKFIISPADMIRDEIYAPFANSEYNQGRNRSDNYAAHLTWNINEKHKLDLAVFGSPSQNNGLIRNIGRRVDPVDDAGIPVKPGAPNGVIDSPAYDGALGRVKVKDISASLKYFGVITNWMNVEALVSFHRNQVIETPAASAQGLRYDDSRRVDIYNYQVLGGFPTTVSPSTYTFGGLGFYQGGSNDQNTDYLLKVTNNFHLGGEHELKWGVDYADLKYREDVLYTGPKPNVFVAANNNGYGGVGLADGFANIRTGVQVTVRCFNNINPGGTNINSICPYTTNPGTTAQYYRVYRGNINPATPNTNNKELNLFVQDKWAIKNVTLNLGIRWNREKISNPSSYKLTSTVSGNPLIAGPQTSGVNPPAVGSRTADCVANSDYSPGCYIAGPGIFVGTSYKFRGEFSPRIGVSWDIFGNGKSKLYGNFARLYERVPNDLAVRSFGNEFGVTNISFQNPDLTSQNRMAFTTGAQPTRVVPGTRLPYKDDFILGYQFEIRPRFLVDIKANFRKQGRILEDTQTSTVEAIQNNYYDGLLGTPYSCLGCYPGQTMLFPGAGNAAFGEYVLANVGDNAPTFFNNIDPVTGLPDGTTTPITFGKPKSEYKALSITLTKQAGEGEHLSLQASYRISRVSGNYEGLFRNDNGQSDPNITSLFDFPDSPLLHTLYTNGRLNSDTPHSLKVNVGYNDLFIKNLYGAVTFKWQSGQLRTPLLAHPVYSNAGEIPGINPQYYILDTNLDGIYDTPILKSYTPVERGFLGRQSDDATWDVKFGYKWTFHKSALDFSILVKNLFNDNHVTRYDDDVEGSAGVLNPSYGSPTEAKAPRSIRVGAKWSF